MSEIQLTIGELRGLVAHDIELKVLERIADMYVRLNEPQEALRWKWRVAAVLQGGSER